MRTSESANATMSQYGLWVNATSEAAIDPITIWMYVTWFGVSHEMRPRMGKSARAAG